MTDFNDYGPRVVPEQDLDGQVEPAYTRPAMNVEEHYLRVMNANNVQFVAYGDEVCPETQRPHKQVFLYMKHQCSWSNKNLGKIGSWWGPTHCHVQPMYGSFGQNEAYCSKEGSYHKLGDEPKQGARGSIEENKELLLSGQITADALCLLDPVHFHMYGRTYDRMEDIAHRRKYRTEMTQGTWYHGPTGAGKSHRAFDNYHPDTHYVKECGEGDSKWWDGYKGQEVVILDDFRGGMPYGELLSLCDKCPKKVSRRCREPVPFLAKRIIVTSSKPPEALYSNCDGNAHAQLYRRFEVFHLRGTEPEPWQAPDPHDW